MGSDDATRGGAYPRQEMSAVSAWTAKRKIQNSAPAIKSFNMCGRAYETYTEKELNARYIRGSPSAEEIEQLSLIPEPVYNLCPTMNSPVLRIVRGSRRFCLMHWQLIPQYEPAF